jgi:hypothetical protein
VLHNLHTVHDPWFQTGRPKNMVFSGAGCTSFHMIIPACPSFPHMVTLACPRIHITDLLCWLFGRCTRIFSQFRQSTTDYTHLPCLSGSPGRRRWMRVILPCPFVHILPKYTATSRVVDAAELHYLLSTAPYRGLNTS